MNRKVAQLLEIALSVAVVVSLYLVGTYLKPKEKTVRLERPPIELRDRFYGAAIPPDDPSVVWVVGKEGKILRSEDGGKSWKVQSSGTREHLQDVAAWDSRRAVVVGNTALILVTSDAGRTWTSVPSPKASVDNKLLRVRIDPEGTAWAVGVMGTVLASTDRGASWTRKMPEQDVAWNDVGFSEPGVTWVVGEFGRMMRSTADGWEALKPATDRSLMTVVFRDSRNALAAGVEGTLLRTEDGGATWLPVSLPTREHLFGLTFVGDRWVGVGGRGLFIEGDPAGSKWQAGLVGEQDYTWHTDVLPHRDELLIVGATLGARAGAHWRVYGRN